MHEAVFVTGTDTGIGKTFAILKIMHWLKSIGTATVGLKPIAAGEIAGVNDDALLLQQASSVQLDYNVINPCLLKTAASPHIAAELEQRIINPKQILSQLQPALQLPNTIKLIEGAGGWLCPLTADLTYADVVVAWQFPVILIVGQRLGCLNHAQLTAAAIINSGAQLIGWVANAVDPKMAFAAENKQYLISHLPAPLLGEIKFGGEFIPH